MTTFGFKRLGPTIAVGAAFAFVGEAAADDHPFTLVNVVDLFELFSLNNPDTTFDPNTQAPANWNEYVAAARIGTNPCVVATDGQRAWIGGFYNGANFNRFGDVATNRAAWYAATGVAEVRDITSQSGFGGNWVRYPGTFQVGPGIRNTDWMSGLDYDPINKILYVAYDATQPPFSTIMPDPGLPWQFYETYIAAVDADEQSPTYGQNLWQRQNPVPALPGFPANEVRSHAGVSIDPLGNWIAYPIQGLGKIAFFDVTNPFGSTMDVFVTDIDALGCNSTAFRGHDFHPETGEWYSRVLNGIQYVARDTREQIAPFRPYSRFIREPDQGGNGVADTLAQGDDVQIAPFGAPVAPTENIIGVGPNGVLDTTPGGDDVRSTSAIVTERILGNPDGNCPTDPDGFPAGNNPQGQGLAIIPSSNLEVATQDLLVANNRAVFGAGTATDIRFFDLNGGQVAVLPLPCSPIPGGSTGIGIYDFDYDPASGTLVVLEFERRLLFVYKTQLAGGPNVPRFDFTRNGRTDLRDLLNFQLCFTGPENTSGLSLNCMRMNADSDCDVDFDDFLAMEQVWESVGGP